MLVNEVAKKLGINPDKVRFYTRIQLLRPEKNRLNGYREYGEEDINRLKFILTARQLGFSIDDIHHILSDADKKKSACPRVRSLIDKRLQEMEQQFSETQQLRERMQEAVSLWSQKPNKVPTGQMICHLIEEFVIQNDSKD